MPSESEEWDFMSSTKRLGVVAFSPSMETALSPETIHAASEGLPATGETAIPEVLKTPISTARSKLGTSSVSVAVSNFEFTASGATPCQNNPTKIRNARMKLNVTPARMTSDFEKYVFDANASGSADDGQSSSSPFNRTKPPIGK